MDTALQPAAIPTSHQDLATQLSAILTGVAIAPLTDRAFLRITGPDASRWLNGMVTNNIQSLQPGEGNYNFLLNAQGRILGDCTIYRDPTPEPATYLLETDASQIETIQQHLDKFIIMDDVELAAITPWHIGILIAGPNALRTVQQIGGAPCSVPDVPAQRPPAPSLKRTTYRGVPVLLICSESPSVPRFEIWGEPGTMTEITAELASAAQVYPEALELLRLLEGTPRYGSDIRNTAAAHDLPQETAQTRALHFSKGCYLGQEIVERIHSRGSVHRTFSGFQLTGSLPAAGTILSADGKAVGELTSVAAIPLAAGTVQLALGYLRRDALGRRLALDYPVGTASPIALPYAIP
jgi:aminomethyltransferase